MTSDLSGGLDVTREYLFPHCPETPGMRDAVNMWVSDDHGALGLPRFAVEAVAPDWQSHDLSVNIAFPNGRVLSLRDHGDAHPTIDDQGRPCVLGAGPLVFRCIEPFRRWDVDFKGTAAQMTTLDQMHGALPGKGPMVDVEFHLVTTMATPPWIQGTLSAQAASLLNSGIEGGLMGGPRYEQLFRAEGMLRVGTEIHRITGSGLRIRRQGVRKIEGFWGHCWQSALFPSGRAFGFITYPPRDDGKPSYNEGYVYEGSGELVPARVVDAPWLRQLCAAGDDVSVLLETAHGRIRIEGETLVSTFAMGRPEMPPDFPVLQQAGARYRWDGEETFGMMERSSPQHKVSGLTRA